MECLEFFFVGLDTVNPCDAGAGAHPSVEILSWPTTVSRSSDAGLVVTFKITGPRWVNLIDVDLIGDGAPGMQFDLGVNTDARNIRQVGFIPERLGTFSLVVRVRDIASCDMFNNTPQRIVTVTP